MKSMRPLHLFFVGLTLVLSLVSFSAATNHSPGETVSTELVVQEYRPDTRFSIQIHKVDKAICIAFTNHKKFTFFTFKKNQDLKNDTLFKSYLNKTLCIETELLQTKLYTFLNTKILYEDVIV